MANVKKKENNNNTHTILQNIIRWICLCKRKRALLCFVHVQLVRVHVIAASTHSSRGCTVHVNVCICDLSVWYGIYIDFSGAFRLNNDSENNSKIGKNVQTNKNERKKKGCTHNHNNCGNIVTYLRLHHRPLAYQRQRIWLDMYETRMVIMSSTVHTFSSFVHMGYGMEVIPLVFRFHAGREFHSSSLTSASVLLHSGWLCVATVQSNRMWLHGIYNYAHMKHVSM